MSPEGNKSRILIAVGDRETRSAYTWCLLSAGYWVEPVSNGLDAGLALERPEPLHVAVVDLGLPGFSGRKLIEGMCSSEQFNRTPIIALDTIGPFVRLPPGVRFMQRPLAPEILLAAVITVGGDALKSRFSEQRLAAARRDGRHRHQRDS